MKKEICRLLKKKVLRSWGSRETLGTRKDRRHRNAGLNYSRSKLTSFYKKQSNKKVRRIENISSGNGYRKVFDYQRTIY